MHLGYECKSAVHVCIYNIHMYAFWRINIYVSYVHIYLYKHKKKVHVYTKKILPIKINLVGPSFSCQINDRRCTTSKNRGIDPSQYGWWFRNPIPNHRPGMVFSKPVVNNGINYQPPLHWLARFRFLNESTVRRFFEKKTLQHKEAPTNG